MIISNPQNMVSNALFHSQFIEAKNHEEKVNESFEYLMKRYNTACQNTEAIWTNLNFARAKLMQVILEKEEVTMCLDELNTKDQSRRINKRIKLIQTQLEELNEYLKNIIDCVNHITNKYNIAFKEVYDIFINIGHVINSKEIAVSNRKALESKLYYR